MIESFFMSLYRWFRQKYLLGMKALRLWFVILFSLVFSAALILQTTEASFAQLSRPEIRGVWMTINDNVILSDRPRMQESVAQLAKLNFNTLYPVVWNSGYATYPSNVAQAAGSPYLHRGQQGHDVLADLIAQAHSKGMKVIPWFEFGFMVPSSSELALAHPDWLTQKRDGSNTSEGETGEVVWLNPFHPEAQQFITNLVVEVVTQYDADGIQFDDHMSLPREFGYDRYTTDLYRKETKRNPPSPQDPAWTKWRADKLTAYMVQLNRAVKSRRSDAIFSVSPNYYDFAYKLHLQDWKAWVNQNIVDELIVQVYRRDLRGFAGQINRAEIQEAQRKIPTGIGVLTGLRKDRIPMAQIWEQVQALRDRNLGMVFFYYESLWDMAPEKPRDRQDSFLAMFPESVDRPRRPEPVIVVPAPSPTTSPTTSPGPSPTPTPPSIPFPVESIPVLDPSIPPPWYEGSPGSVVQLK
jgi:uncharacterized lipoprotein YddW (UPF0748 family)